MESIIQIQDRQNPFLLPLPSPPPPMMFCFCSNLVLDFLFSLFQLNYFSMDTEFTVQKMVFRRADFAASKMVSFVLSNHGLKIHHTYLLKQKGSLFRCHCTSTRFLYCICFLLLFSLYCDCSCCFPLELGSFLG